MLIPLSVFVLLAASTMAVVGPPHDEAATTAAQPQARELLVAKKADSEQPAL
jgi:mannose/cellobiose epimerase-like protein (N-acyl-D-glucosamine 2-epimerase family)